MTSNEIDKNSEEFGYIQRNEFTSEIYKIEVRNLGIFGIGVSTQVVQNFHLSIKFLTSHIILGI